MILTEAEATNKLCHETLLPIGVGEGVYRDVSVCVGSGCMAWRWALADPPSGSPRADRTRGDMFSYGYCGKAGRP